MITVKIKKDLKNIYPNQTVEDLKKLSAEVFKGLEEIMAQHEDLALVKQDYDDYKKFFSDYFVKGKLAYKDYKGKEEISLNDTWYGGLKIKFFASFQSFGEEGYNRIKIKSWGDSEKIPKIVEELANKFKSFEGN